MNYLAQRRQTLAKNLKKKVIAAEQKAPSGLCRKLPNTGKVLSRWKVSRSRGLRKLKR